jgi:hypothetical protein
MFFGEHDGERDELQALQPPGILQQGIAARSILRFST